MDRDKKDGGPAFPREDYQTDNAGGQQGMTLRDYFAAKALPAAWMAFDSGYFGDTSEPGQDAQNIANCAYQLADAMLKAREV